MAAGRVCGLVRRVQGESDRCGQRAEADPRMADRPQCFRFSGGWLGNCPGVGRVWCRFLRVGGVVSRVGEPAVDAALALFDHVDEFGVGVLNGLLHEGRDLAHVGGCGQEGGEDGLGGFVANAAPAGAAECFLGVVFREAVVAFLG